MLQHVLDPEAIANGLGYGPFSIAEETDRNPFLDLPSPQPNGVRCEDPREKYPLAFNDVQEVEWMSVGYVAKVPWAVHEPDMTLT